MFALYAPLFAGLILSAASPSAPPAEPLREIGHVRASAFCSELAHHANGAISAALRNDNVIIETIGKMHTAQLDGNVITRRNTLQSLGDLAKELRARAVAGDGEAARLRAMAATATDPDQKKELKSFADALGGALYRQKKIANDLNGLLAAFDYHDMRPTSDELNRMYAGTRNQPIFSNADQSLNQRPESGFGGDQSDTDLAAIAASDFAARIPDISNDEAIASNHALGATSGC